MVNFTVRNHDHECSAGGSGYFSPSEVTAIVDTTQWDDKGLPLVVGSEIALRNGQLLAAKERASELIKRMETK